MTRDSYESSFIKLEPLIVSMPAIGLTKDDLRHFHWLEHGFSNDSPWCPWCGADYDSGLHLDECIRILDPHDDCDVCGRVDQAYWCWACDGDDMDHG